MLKPTDYIDWMPGDTSVTTIVEPPTEKKTLGWLSAEKPPYQFFNWLWQRVGDWTKFFSLTTSQYDVTIGAGTDCTHATLAAALADSGVGTYVRVLLRDNISGGATAISLTKAGWKIFARPGVTLTKVGAATTGLSVAAADVEINGLRLAGFTIGIAFTVAGNYGRVLFCNFGSGTTTEIDDSAVTVGKVPVALGNHSEV